MAFIATDICKSIALREGIASALADLNISRNESYKSSNEHLTQRNKELETQRHTKITCKYTWKKPLVWAMKTRSIEFAVQKLKLSRAESQSKDGYKQLSLRLPTLQLSKQGSFHATA